MLARARPLVTPTPERRPKPWKAYGRYGSVGIELVLSLLLGMWLGTKGDAHFHTSPYLTLLGMIFGAYAGFRVVWKAAQHMQADAEEEERRDRGESPWSPPQPPSASPPPEPQDEHGNEKDTPKDPPKRGSP